MGLQRFERRLERLVEGAFSKAFRSGLQPVEIGRRVVREMDVHRSLGVRGTVVPNKITVMLSREDLERFAGFHDSLERELADAAREHAREEGYHFSGPVEVRILADDGARRGDLRVDAQIVAGPHGVPATLVLPDTRRIELGDEPALIGRLPDCAVALTDPQVSRHHAEIRYDERGYHVVDLDSMNGIEVNGVRVRDHLLRDGDVIRVGATEMRYEES
jgi:hypothetical protein